MSSSNIRMDNVQLPKPCSLVMYGLTSNFNKIIHAISSCPIFVWKLRKLQTENKQSSGISTINSLIELAINKANIQNIELSSITLKQWNNGNRDNCYDLMMLILNDIYSEKRNINGNPSNDEWLKERLPARIIMEYLTYCDCGYKTYSPKQSELAISVMGYRSLSNNAQSLTDKYFNEGIIDGKVCTSNCSRNQGKHVRKLSLPLPETLCIHIERSESRVKVTHGDSLTIKKEYCVVMPERDIVYSLKSVITYNDDVCYRKLNNDWYNISDNELSLVDVTPVMNCKAYILFYELKDGVASADGGDEMCESPVSLVDYCLSDSVHCVIQSLASCSRFVQWLDNCDEEEETPVQDTVMKLMAEANCADNETGAVQSDIISNMNSESSSDVYEVVKELLDQVLAESTSDTNSDGSEKCIPWRLITSRLIGCDCGSKIMSNTQIKVSFDISSTEDNCDDNSMDRESKDVQSLLDAYFQEESDGARNCVKTKCRENNVSSRVLLQYPLPQMIIVHLIPGSNDTVTLNEQLILRGQFSVISDRCNRKSYTNESTIFNLKSVLMSEGGNCYRKWKNQWFCVDDRTTERIGFDDVSSNRPRVLFYELENCDEETEDGDVERGEKVQNSEETGSCVTRIIQLLASSVKFVEWLNMAADNEALVEVRTLTSSVNNANRRMQDNCQSDDSVWKKWNNLASSDIYEVLRVILDGVVEEGMKQETGEDANDHPIVIYNLSAGTATYSLSSLPIINLDVLSHSRTDQVALQELLDKHFEIRIGFNQLCFKGLANVETIPLTRSLLDTICFHFPSSDHCYVCLAMDIVIKNMSCVTCHGSCRSGYINCCRRYSLRSFVDNEGYCYKIIRDKIYKIADCQYVLFEEDEALSLAAKIALYELQQ